MAGKPSRKQRLRPTVSIDPTGCREALPDAAVKNRRIVRRALTLHPRDGLHREIERFCAMPDATDLDDARRALPAQREALGHD